MKISTAFDCIRWLSMALVFFTAACSREPRPAQREWPVMGTFAQLTLHQHDARRIAEAHAIVANVFELVEAHLSLFDPASPLAQINALAGEPFATPLPYPHAAPLEFALAVAAQSGGAFDPTIGPLMRLWGFRGGPVLEPPDPETIAFTLAACVGFRHVRALPVYFDNHVEVRLEKPSMSLDLGAIAKGFAVDWAVEELACAGFTHAQVNLGGDLRVMGAPSATRGEWRAGIRDPFTPGAFAESLSLWHGEAVATSGNYERFVEYDGVRYAHILDGRTGWPVTNIVSVTVVSPTAMEADALATTLFVLGPDEGMDFLQRLYPDSDALWITDKPDSRRIASPGMNLRLAR